MAARLAADLQGLRYAEDVRRLYHQLRRSVCQSLLGLANALEAKDPCTRGHSERVGAWARRLGTVLPPLRSRRRELPEELGRTITGDYVGREPVLVTVLTGGAVFLADLIRAVDLPVETIPTSGR